MGRRGYVLTTVLLAGLLLAGCRSKKDVVVVPTETVVTRVERMTEVRLDTVYVEVPMQSAEATTRDSVSVLETDYALSEARINLDGTLYHKLRNKAEGHAAVVPRVTERVDSVYVREATEPVYVEQPTGRWQRFKAGSFWWLVGVSGVLLLYVFRRPLLRVIGKG